MVFVTAALKSWRLESIDITAAFLQGGSLERYIFKTILIECNSKKQEQDLEGTMNLKKEIGKKGGAQKDQIHEKNERN